MHNTTTGLALARRFYVEEVRPILEADFPGLAHSAALIGTGSEVLGFDNVMSRDHNWGPRVDLFLSELDHARWAEELRAALGQRLPFQFQGHSTHFENAPDDPTSLVPKLVHSRPVHHRVQVLTLRAFLGEYVGLQPGSGPTLRDWLSIPEQKLRTLTKGAVYHDGLGVLEPLRRSLAYYPHDVWLYLLSAGWQRIGQEEPFVGRAGSVGDEVGSAVIAARLVRDAMRLALLMDRQYAPYSKWFGSAFAQLSCAPSLTPIFEQALRAEGWQGRQEHLASAYEILARMHNALGVIEPVAAQVRRFYERPFRVIGGEDIALKLWDAIQDEQVRALPYGVGKVDQFVDSTDVLSHDRRCRAIMAELCA